jgi:tetratricopeptide (TPR) repeat protein
MHRSCLLAVLFSSLSALAADPHWIRAQSPNFEIYSTANETNVRTALLYFEQLHSFFETLAPVDTEKTPPVRIVAFNSPKEFEPYRPTETAVAYYASGVERDILVMDHIGPDTFPIAIKEYFHLAANHWAVKFPFWMGQGMAELYSTIRSLPDSTVVGDLIPGRVQPLRTAAWVPLDVIIAVNSGSSYVNDKIKAASFYNEAWALTHMLYLSQEYRPRFPDFLTALAGGKDSVDALTSVYGKPLKAIEDDLRSYVRGDRFRTVVFPSRLRAEKLSIKPEPAPAFDVRLALAEMSQRHGQSLASFQQEVEALAQEQPDRSEPHVILGYLILRGPGTEPGKRAPASVQEEAEKQFDSAFNLGDRSPRMLWEYGRAIATRNPKQSEAVLRRLLTVQPDRSQVSVELASVVLGEGQAAEALKILNALPEKMTSDEAPRYYNVSARVYSSLGQRENARAFANKLLNATKATVADKQWAQRFLENPK